MAGYATGFGASPVSLNVGAVKVEPKRHNRFKVSFSGGLLDGNVTANVVNVSRPNETFDEIQVHRGESITYFAGKPHFDDVTIQFDDSLDNSLADALYAQRSTQFDTSTLAVAKDASSYKFTTVIEITDGSGAVIETITLYGSWIKTLSPDQMDYTNSDAAKVSVTLRYDLPVRT